MKSRYSAFYEEYKDKLFAYIMRMSGDYELARELMQESFTRHFQHYGNNDAHVPSVLFIIARNALVDHQRRHGRYQQVQDDSLHDGRDEEKTCILREECRGVEKAFQKLSEADREMLSLAVGGLAYKQIATVMGISEANLKVRIHRARIKLRQMLSNGET